MGKEVGNVQEGVAQHLENVLHTVRVEKTKQFRSGYSWSTEYSKNKIDEARTVTVPEETSYNVFYAYQLLTQADLRHLVVYSAFEQGLMDEEVKIELLEASIDVLRRFKGLREEVKEDKNVGEDILEIYKRIAKELRDEGIIKLKKKK